MKGNKFVGILVVVILSIFSFNRDVYAAKELTCVYKGGYNSPSIMLVQNVDGKLTIYTDDDRVGNDQGEASTIKDERWVVESTYEVNLDKVKESKKNSDGSLKECPSYYSTPYIGNGDTFRFSDEKGALDFDYQLTDHLEEETTITKTEEDAQQEEKGFTYGTFSDMEGVTSCKYQNNDRDWIQLQYNTEKIMLSTSYGNQMNNSEGVGSFDNNIKIDFDVSNLNIKSCPMDLYAKHMNATIPDYSGGPSAVVETLDISLSKKTGYDMFMLVSGNKKFTPIKLLHGDIVIESCEDLFGNDDALINMFKTGKNILMILIPIILLVLGSLDFAQAVFSQNEDGIKKAQSKFIRRLIIAVVIFLIPSILKVILSLANSIWGNIDTTFCGILD